MTGKYHTDNWVDAMKMAQNFPTSFTIPSEEDLTKLKKGSLIKLSNGIERFWVIIEWFDDDSIYGVVDNDLGRTTKYGYGDTVVFKKNHILDICD